MIVLIAVDDDEASQAALEFADQLVGPDDDVSVLHVARGVVPYVAGPFGGYVLMPPDAELVDQIDEKASALVERDAEMISSGVSKLIEYGDPAERICAAAAEHNADLIIIGSHDRGAFGRFLHGSVSDQVVHHAPCSVLVAKSVKN